MGMKSKSLRAVKRKAEKRAKKTAKAALYKSYSETGGKRRKRQKGPKTATSKKYAKGNHPASCGNAGCKKCFPRKLVFAPPPAEKKAA